MYRNVAENYYSLDDFDNSKKHLNIAIDIVKNEKNHELWIDILFKLSALNYEMNNFLESKKDLNNSLQVAKESKNEDLINLVNSRLEELNDRL